VNGGDEFEVDVVVDVGLFVVVGDGGLFAGGQEFNGVRLAEEGEFLGEGYSEVLVYVVVEEIFKAFIHLTVVIFHILQIRLLILQQFQYIRTQRYILHQLIIHKELPQQPAKHPKMLPPAHHRLTHHTWQQPILTRPRKQPHIHLGNLLNHLSNPLQMQPPTINPILLNKLNLIILLSKIF
jgi:hypothetical protein